MRLRYVIIIVIVTCCFLPTIRAQQCADCNKRTHFDFELLEKEGLHIDTNVVRVDGVYFSEWEITNLEKKKVKQYYFIRFFSDGRMYFSCAYCSFPKAAELNDLNYGSYGYYSVKGNDVKIETYAEYAKYHFEFGLIEGDKFIANGASKRKWKGKLKIVNQGIKHSWQFYPCSLTSVSFW